MPAQTVQPMIIVGISDQLNHSKRVSKLYNRLQISDQFHNVNRRVRQVSTKRFMGRMFVIYIVYFPVSRDRAKELRIHGKSAKNS